MKSYDNGEGVGRGTKSVSTNWILLTKKLKSNVAKRT